MTTMTEQLLVEVGGETRLPVHALTHRELRDITRRLTFINARRRTIRRMRRMGYEPQSIKAFRHEDEFLIIPRGMGPYLRKLFQDRLTVRDNTVIFDPVDVSFSGTLRPYQRRALDGALKRRDAVVVAPCGSGKTVLGLAWVAARRQPTLWLVHTTDLLEQAVDEAKTFLNIEAGRIGGGRWDMGRVLTVATVQTLVRHLDKLPHLPFGAVVLDEAHHVPARTFSDVMGRLPARYRLGLTATPQRSDGLTDLITYTMGQIVATITQEDLQAAGINVRPSLVWVDTSFTYEGDSEDRHYYTYLVNALTQDPDRNRLALALIEQEAKRGHVVLVLTDRVAHARLLADELTKRGVTAAALDGKVPTEDRQDMLTRFRKRHLSVIVATRLADEGLDVPELDRLFLLTPMRAAGRVQQRLGRLMRAKPGKDPIVFDFRDPLVSLLASQARSRWFKVYRHIVKDQTTIGGEA